MLVLLVACSGKAPGHVNAGRHPFRWLHAGHGLMVGSLRGRAIHALVHPCCMDALVGCKVDHFFQLPAACPSGCSWAKWRPISSWYLQTSIANLGCSLPFCIRSSTSSCIMKLWFKLFQELQAVHGRLEMVHVGLNSRIILVANTLSSLLPKSNAWPFGFNVLKSMAHRPSIGKPLFCMFARSLRLPFHTTPPR